MPGTSATTVYDSVDHPAFVAKKGFTAMFDLTPLLLESPSNLFNGEYLPFDVKTSNAIGYASSIHFRET